jgi:low temperature requirement protein LtrA
MRTSLDYTRTIPYSAAARRALTRGWTDGRCANFRRLAGRVARPIAAAAAMVDTRRAARLSHIRVQPDDEHRVDSAELFFDLVFVFAVTQLSQRLLHDLTVLGAAQTTFLLLAAWWAWLYTTWVTNWFDAATVVVRATLLVGMLASLLGAVAIPEAFGDRALLFAIGYVGIQSFRNGFIVLATSPDDPLRRPFLRIFTWTCAAGVVWIIGLLVGEDTRFAVWACALTIDYLGPVVGHWVPRLGRSRPSEWQLAPGHFVERLELFLIIALGESIVASGSTASGFDPTVQRLTALLVCVLMTAAFWWLYFDVHAERTLESLRAARDERGRLGRDLSYCYVVLVAGIIVAAVGNELVIPRPGERLDDAELVALASGPVLYLLGSVALKIRVLHVMWQRRFAAAVLVVAAVLVGGSLPALALWAILLAILAALAVAESREPRSQPVGAVQRTAAAPTA